MNKKNNQSNMQAPILEEHETVMALLDAYSTDDLVANEKALVDRHLISCQECQNWLVDISRLHGLLTLPVEDLQASLLNGDPSMSTYRRGISELADNVLDHIAQIDGANAVARSTTSIVQPQPSYFLWPRRKTVGRKRLSWMLGIAAAVMCITVLSVLLSPIISQLISKETTHGGAVESVPYISPWTFYQDQTMVRRGQDVFALTSIPIINESNFSLIYVFHTSHPETLPQVSVISTLPSQPGSSLTIASSVQSLGTIGEFEVGIIQVHMADRIGQSITLQGTFPDQVTPWHLTTFDQRAKLPFNNSTTSNRESYSEYMGDPKALPEIISNDLSPKIVDPNTTGGYMHVLGLLSLSLSAPQKTLATATSIYLRLDYFLKDGLLKVTVISQAEFMNLEEPQTTPTNHG